jgi:hypothetical protein
MNSRRWVGLLAAGPFSPTLFKLADLHDHLDLVAAATLRVASRLANRLKAGRAAEIEEFAHLELILISGPDSSVAGLVQLAAQSQSGWSGVTFVLLDSRHDRSVLEPLAARGAATATLDTLDSFSDPTLLCDCGPESHRLLQRFTAGAKQLCFAALALNHTLFAPVFDASVNALRAAGLSTADSALLADRMVQHTVRSWLKAGRNGWAGPLRDRDLVTLASQRDALARHSAEAARLFAHNARIAPVLFGEEPGPLADLADPPSGDEAEAKADNSSHAARAGR